MINLRSGICDSRKSVSRAPHGEGSFYDWPKVRLAHFAILALLLALFVGCSQDPSSVSEIEKSASAKQTPNPQSVKSSPEINAEKQVYLSEEVIIALGPSITNLNRSVANLSLPDVNSQEFFADEVNLLDVVKQPADEMVLLESIATRSLRWQPDTESINRDLTALEIWKPLFDEIEYLHWSKFAVKKGEFIKSSLEHYKTLLLFNAKARLKSGKLMTFASSVTVKWQLKEDEDGNKKWKIVDWQSQPINMFEVKQDIFRDVLPAVLTDLSEYTEARTSIHEQLTVKVLRGEIKLPPYFRIRELHPAVSVVDLNEDGFDDFYISRRRGKSLFYSSQGDGTYREIAEDLGIDVVDYNIGSIFADFDNDGDKDLFVGRMWGPSKYLVNDGGKFQERPEMFNSVLPYFVGSVNAVDYDQDGLLDIYVSTMGGKHALLRAKQVLGEYPWPEKDIRALHELDIKIGKDILNEPGLPSVMYRNIGGGRFEKVSIPAVEVFGRTLQATWSDFDNDGDPDLYVANDKGFNNLVRNDSDGKFVDITNESKTADLGFGMGVSAGDFNNDGMQDIYVVNMYSKAGQRITGQLKTIRKGYSDAARGNSLFQNRGPVFEKVSGLEPPKLMVEKAGWSWGGQFIDFDNDSFLDIYALSGHYTAPKKVARPGDI